MLIAIDTGGTFTDLAAYDRVTGQILHTKGLTNYGDFVAGVVDCLRRAGISGEQADSVKFGTTLVINAFLQRSGARTALITTEGFRDVLEIRRGNRPIPFDLRFRWDPPLVPRCYRYEVPERMTAQGEILQPLDLEALDRIAQQLRDEKIESVAISFINSYRNPAHEQIAAEALRRALPAAYVTTGTELSREWYEYERLSTAAANAYVGPKLRDYVERLETTLSAEGYGNKFFLMGSNGGVMSGQRAQAQPVMLVESGPVGGCIGAGVYARALGIDKLIAFDMGGTTAKCAVVTDGHYEVKSPYYVGGPERGFPVRGAVVDIIEVGAGGGSIAWLDVGGRLNVGPQSAGSFPGPVAYGKGGTEPTMTDANLVLGKIPASSFLGGELALDEAGARAAIRDKVAAPLGMNGASAIDDAAQGIVDLGATIMAGAIKQITVERGIDPRECALFVFGGGGPLHGAVLARELGIPQVIVPPTPGIFSAFGMLLADARVDHTMTFVRDLDAAAVEATQQAFAELEADVLAALKADGAATDVHFERQAEMRYRGQRQYLKVSLGRAATVDDVRKCFEDSYETRFGHADHDSPSQFVNLVLTATGRGEAPDLARIAQGSHSQSPVASQRSVYFSELTARVDTPVFQRGSLPAGFSAAGPALIEEYGSTTVVGPNDHFRVGKLGEIVIEVRP